MSVVPQPIAELPSNGKSFITGQTVAESSEKSVTEEGDSDVWSERDEERKNMRKMRLVRSSKVARMTTLNKATMLHTLIEGVTQQQKDIKELSEIEQKVEKQEDSKDFKEGIFIFRIAAGIQMPVDEEVYLKYHQHNDECQYKEIRSEELVNLSHEERHRMIKSLKSKREPWEYSQKVVIYDVRSLYLFDHKNVFRRGVIALAESKIFANIIMILILINSVLLACYDYSDREQECEWNKNLIFIGKIFSACFITECGVKIIAQGFVIHQNSYLRDTWNWIDFIVVIGSFITISRTSQTDLGKLRVLRVLRPLRSIKALPGMRKIISSLLHAVQPLTEAIMFMFLIFTLFGLLGIQQFVGFQYQRCRLTPEPVGNLWPYDKTKDHICTLDGTGQFACEGEGISSWCATPADSEKHLSSDIDKPIEQELINYGLMNFDNIFYGFLTIFQIVTLEGWTEVMYNMMDARRGWLAVTMCTSVVILCANFLLNIILAILADEISSDDLEDSNEIKRKAQVSKSILRALNQRQRKVDEKFRQQLEAWSAAPDEKLKKASEIKNNCCSSQNSNSSSFSHDISSQEQVVINQTTSNNFLQRQNANIDKDSETLFGFDPQPKREVLYVPQQSSEEDENVSQSSESSKSSSKDSDAEKKEIVGDDKRNSVQRFCYVIVAHPLFNLYIISLIFVNILVLSFDDVNITEKQVKQIELLHFIFNINYIIEMCIKLVGLGCKEYAHDGYNWLDVTVVGGAMLEFTLNAASPVVSVMRGFRLLRFLKLARRWNAFRNLLRWLGQTLMASAMFIVLFCLFMFIFVLIGQELYANKINFDEDGNVLSEFTSIQKYPPRQNFNSFWNGLITIYIVAIGDDWNKIMFDYYRAMYKTDSNIAPYIAILFFIVTYVMMNMLLLNLFLAILLDSYGDQPDEDAEMLEKEQEEQMEDIGPIYIFIQTVKFRLQSCLSKVFPCWVKEVEARENESDSGSVEQMDAADAFGLKEEPEENISDNQTEITQQFKRKTMMKTVKINGIDNQEAERKLQEPANSSYKSVQESDKKPEEKIIRRVQRKSVPNNYSIQVSSILLRKSLKSKDKKDIPLPLLALRLQRIVERKKKQVEQEDQLNVLKSALKKSNGELKLNKIVTDNIDTLIFKKALQGNSLNLFSHNSRLRKLLYKIAQHKHFEQFIFFLICFSTLLLIADDPLHDPDSTEHYVRAKLDQMTTVLFVLECVMKIVIKGFIVNGDDSYFKSNWNKMDFTIALISSFSFLDLPESYEVVKVLRLLRILRPLRLVHRLPYMKISIESIIQAVPQFFNLLSIFFLSLLLFSILGTTFFKGRFAQCHMDNVGRSAVQTMWECFDAGGEWHNPEANFDNTGQSMVTLFTAVTTEGWADLMWAGVDASDQFLMPQKNRNPIIILYFVFFMNFCSIIMLNLFVGVLIDSNYREQQKLLNTDQLTNFQVEYSDTMTQCYTALPENEYVRTNNFCRDKLHEFAKSKIFRDGITVCIVVNTVVMACHWYNEPVLYRSVVDKVNYAFALIYTIEAIILIFVQREVYFQDGWRQFDFIIVVTAIIGFLVEVVFNIPKGTWTTVLRCFRILRIMKIIKRFRQLNRIFNTFVIALPNLIPMMSLIGLFLVIFAVLGEFLFAKVLLPDSDRHVGLDFHANFQTFGRAMLTLLRICTLDGWNEIMWSCTRTRSILYQCQTTQQDYASIVKNGPQECGPPLTVAYFLTFVIIGVFILTNMFMSIVLNGYNTSNEQEKMRINSDTLDQFKKTWMKYDPRAEGLIKIEHFNNLLIDLILAELRKLPTKGLQDEQQEENILFNLRLDQDLVDFAKLERGIHKDSLKMSNIQNSAFRKRKIRRAWDKFHSQLRLPTYKGIKYYNFHDMLTALTKYFFETAHVRDHRIRLERIKRNKKVGIALTKFESMTEGSVEFKLLSIAEQENFLDMESPDFQNLVNRIELKMERKGQQTIAKLKGMREMRQKADQPFLKHLDTVSDQDRVEIIDSSKVLGARYILNYFMQSKAKKQIQEIQPIFCTPRSEPSKIRIENIASIENSHLTQEQQIEENNISVQEDSIEEAVSALNSKRLQIDSIGIVCNEEEQESERTVKKIRFLSQDLDNVYEDEELSESVENVVFNEENKQSQELDNKKVSKTMSFSELKVQENSKAVALEYGCSINSEVTNVGDNIGVFNTRDKIPPVKSTHIKSKSISNLHSVIMDRQQSRPFHDNRRSEVKRAKLSFQVNNQMKHSSKIQDTGLSMRKSQAVYSNRHEWTSFRKAWYPAEYSSEEGRSKGKQSSSHSPEQNRGSLFY